MLSCEREGARLSASVDRGALSCVKLLWSRRCVCSTARWCAVSVPRHCDTAQMRDVNLFDESCMLLSTYFILLIRQTY